MNSPRTRTVRKDSYICHAFVITRDLLVHSINTIEFVNFLTMVCLVMTWFDELFINDTLAEFVAKSFTASWWDTFIRLSFLYHILFLVEWEHSMRPL
jgi:hypothetical protein